MSQIRYPYSLNSKRLIELQLELECVGVEAGNTLVPIPCSNPDGPVRFLVARHDNTYSMYFRYDLSKRVREQLVRLAAAEAFNNHVLVRAILAQDASCEEIWSGTAYVFPHPLSAGLYPDVVRLDDQLHRELLNRHNPGWTIVGATVYAIIAENRIVSMCSSARENEKCAEAWVTTEPDFRRRGYARQVTTAWAHDLQRQGSCRFTAITRITLLRRPWREAWGSCRFLTPSDIRRHWLISAFVPIA